MFCTSVAYVDCKEYQMCLRFMQNSMGLFSTATKLFVWRLRLRVQKAVTPLLILVAQNVKSVNQYKYLRIALDTELSDDKDIQRQLRHQYCAANKLRASFSRCSNAVKNLLFRSFCTAMYASQLWCNFRKSCMQMQKLHVVYNFWCRALCNLPWRACVSSLQVQYNIPTFEALLRKYTYLFLERCRKSNSIWLRVLMQSDCLHSSKSLDTTIAFHCVNEWSNFAVSVRLMACHVTKHSHFTWTQACNQGGGHLLPRNFQNIA